MKKLIIFFLMIFGMIGFINALSINNSLPSTYGEYTIDFSDFVSCTDSTNCNISIDNQTTSILAPYDLAEFSQQASQLISETNSPWAIALKTDGTKLYLSNTGLPGRVNQFNLTTPWDISTKVADGSFSVGSQDNTPNGIFWKTDGTKFYMLGNDFDDIFEYTVSSAWDITSASFSTSKPVTGSSVSGLYFKDDGTKFYYVDDGANRFYEFTMSTPWSVSTATQTAFISTQDANPSDVKFSSDGLKMFLSGRSADDVYQYSLTSAFDLSTATYDSVSINVATPSPSGFFFKDDGTEFYLVENNGDRVYTYAIGSSEYTFNTPGNKSYTIFASNSTTTINESGNIFINPSFTFQFNDSGSFVTNYTYGGISDILGVVTLNFLNDSLVVGENSLDFTKFGYITQEFTFSTENVSTQNITFNVTPAVINVNVYDRITGSFITDNVTLQLVGNVGDTTSTVTGQASMQAINGVAGDYQIIASSSLYETESIYFTYSNQENLTTNIYMIKSNETNIGVTNVEVKDTLSFFIEGATVNLLEWKPSQSAYVTTAQCSTTSTGRCSLNVELFDKLYKFQAVKIGNSKTTNSQILAENNLVIPITLGESALSLSTDLENLAYSFTETIAGNVSTTRFEFLDTTNVVTQACISTYQDVGYNQMLLSQNCSSSNSGILFKSNNINNSFDLNIIATVTSNGILYNIDEFKHAGTGGLGSALEQNNLDIVLPLLFLLLGLFIGLFFGNLYISLIAIVVLEWIAVKIVPTQISASIAVSLTILTGLILWGISKK